VKLRLTAAALLVSLALAFAMAPVSTALAQTETRFPVTGTGSAVINGVTTPVNFVGTFAIQKFDVVGGKVVAIGTLSGTATNALTGATLGTVSNLRTTIPLIDANATGDCQILHLELGPLDLDLLGLKVHLDKVVLDISAQPGPGNLLGNLLCAIAGLLDNSAPLNLITDALNLLLDTLRWAR
jgi:hypothetical protein